MSQGFFVDNTVGRSDLYTPRFLLVLILMSNDECPLLEITILWQQSYPIPERCQLKMPLFTIVYYLLYIFNLLILITEKITNAIFSEGELACFQLHSDSQSRVRMVMEKNCLSLKCVSNWIKSRLIFFYFL